MNWMGVARSNYFRVKELEAFKNFCEEHAAGATFVYKDDDDTGKYSIASVRGGSLGPIEHHPLVGLLFEESGLPGVVDIDGTSYDFADAFSTHLVTGEVAIFMEAGFEGMRYASGIAWAVNWKGESREIYLSDIHKLAEELRGPETGKITACEY